MSQSSEYKMALETAEHHWIARMSLNQGDSTEASEMLKQAITSRHPGISQQERQAIVTKVISNWQAG